MATTHLKTAVGHYLASQASYALLITGEWGSGKTHFLRHQIFPLIKDTPSLADASVNYNVIELSVFGLTSIEEIETKILVQLLPLLGDEPASWLAKGAGLFTRAWLALKPTAADLRIVQAGGKLAEDTTAEVLRSVQRGGKAVASKLVDFRRFVICVDDIERGIAEDGLSLNKLLGCLNNLVEHGFKVLAVANEGKLPSDQLEQLKEKVIGETLLFSQSLPKVLDEVLAAELPDQQVFQKFLSRHTTLLTELFPQSNLRTFIRFVHKLLPLHSTLTVAADGSLVKRVHLDSALPALVRFAAAVFTEFQNNRLTYRDHEQLQTVLMQFNQSLNMAALGRDAPIDSPPAETLVSAILRQYYGGRKSSYHFFTHVFDYLVAGAPIDADKLIDEFAAVFPLDSTGHLRPAQRVVRQLEYENALLVSEAQYEQLLWQLLDHVDAGDYLLGEYITLYWRVMLFDNPLGLTPEELTIRLARGMQKSLPNSGPIANAEMYLNLDGIAADEHYRFLARLRRITLAYNQRLLTERLREVQQQATDILASEGATALLDFVSERNRLAQPLLATLDANSFATALLADLPAFVRLPVSLQERAAYGHGIAEYAFFEHVMLELDHRIAPTGVERHRLQRLARALASNYYIITAEPLAGSVKLD
jgi:hypothetical protein